MINLIFDVIDVAHQLIGNRHITADKLFYFAHIRVSRDHFIQQLQNKHLLLRQFSGFNHFRLAIKIALETLETHLLVEGKLLACFDFFRQ